MDSMDFDSLINVTIPSPYAEYLVQSVLGYGGFGVVLQCLKKPINEIVALKVIINEQCVEFAKNEVEILKFLTNEGAEHFHIVTCHNAFQWEDIYCIEFDKLNMSLFDHLEDNTFTLQEIRPILFQLITSLSFLEYYSIVHADIKPENIMFVDHERQPFKIKLIDFGLAMIDPEELQGDVRGTVQYRAPEMVLGAPLNQRLDTWSLGCLAAEMLTGRSLFPGRNHGQVMQYILKTTGLPPTHVMSAGKYTDRMFHERSTRRRPHIWSIKPRFALPQRSLKQIKCLNSLLKVPPETVEDDIEAMELDRLAFVDLVTKMLNVDPAQRITPEEMLDHSFFTLNHLDAFRHFCYVESSVQLMQVCQIWNFEEDLMPPSNDCSSLDRRENSNEQSSGENPPVRETFRRSSYNLRKRKHNDDDSSLGDSDDTPQRKRRKHEHADTDQTQNRNTGDKANANSRPIKKAKRRLPKKALLN